MTGTGRAASRPPTGWQPPSRRDGLRVRFVSEDGRHQRWFDFAALPGSTSILSELADTFAELTGSLGTWRRPSSGRNLWAGARRIAEWIAVSRPSASGLADLTAADAAMLLRSLKTPTGYSRHAEVRILFKHRPGIDPEVVEQLRLPQPRQETTEQPYSDQELIWITSLARGIVRRARMRLRRHWQLVADYRAGAFDQLAPNHPEHTLARALDHCARVGDTPRAASDSGMPGHLHYQARAAAGAKSLMPLLHLDGRDAWAFAVLLAALTGLNVSTIDALPALHSLATASDEAGIALVRASKPRRGTRSEMTVPLTAMPAELRPGTGDNRPRHVLNTSLTTAYGVFNLLTELTGPGRAMIGSDRAFVFVKDQQFNPRAGFPTPLFEGLPFHKLAARRRWLEDLRTGQDQRDRVLLETSLNRLRKTFLERHRRPVAHTPATLSGYLRRMRSVTEEGFQVVRDALDEQVANALAQRRMLAVPRSAPETVTGEDTVIGSCLDFARSPLDDGGPCQQSFLSCLDCSNARALPHHLPMQLAVLDGLRSQRQAIPAERWVSEHAGRIAQLQDLLEQFEPAQVKAARARMTDTERRLAARLLDGELDPL